MVLNKKHYRVHTIHNGLDKESSLLECPIAHKVFETRGEYNFGELELYLGAHGWTEIYPLMDKNEVIASIKEDGTKKKRKKIL